MRISFNTYNINFKTNSNRVCQKPVYTKSLSKDIVSFSSSDVDKEDAYNLRNIPDQVCSCCGKKMINEGKFKELKSKHYQGPAAPVLKKIKPFVKEMRPVEKTVYNLLKRTSLNHPNDDLNTLINKRYYYHLSRLEAKQLKIINKAIDQNLNLSENSKDELNKTMGKIREIMFVEAKEERQKRSRIIQEFNKLKERVKGKEKEKIDKIIQIIRTLPNSQDDVDSFMTKYTQRGNREIGQRLLSPSLPTLDHIEATSKNGPDDFSNILVMCAKCNSNRGNLPYPLLFLQYPEMPQNIQRNMSKVIKEINEGRLKNFDNYPQDVKNRLQRITRGELILDISSLKPMRSTSSL